MQAIAVSVEEIGQFVDAVAKRPREPKAVVGRLLEEVVELGLEAGLDAQEILGHVVDSLHAQCLKMEQAFNHTVFPTYLLKHEGVTENFLGEIVDVSLLLKDLIYVSGVKLSEAEREKFESLKKKEFYVSEKGTIYTKKSHVKG